MRDIARELVWVAREMADLLPEVVSLRQVMSFLKRQRTWFDFELGNDKIWVGTREHGSFEDESAGEDDIREAKRLSQLLNREFGDAVSAVIKLVDDWTYLVVFTPKTAASRRKESVSGELLKIARILVSKPGDTIRVKIPGLGEAMENVTANFHPGFYIPIEEPEVKKVIDRGMRSKGFSERQKGVGTYGSEYWEKGGKKYRVHDDSMVDKDILILEEILLAIPW